jgi:hypothetical protein
MQLFHLTEAVTSAERCLAEASVRLQAAKKNLRAFAGTGRVTVAKDAKGAGPFKPVKASSNLGRIVAALGKGTAPKQIAADLGYTAKWGEKAGTDWEPDRGSAGSYARVREQARIQVPLA